MHANRLLRSEQRAQELVLYDFLARLYDSEVARARGASKRAKDGDASPLMSAPLGTVASG